MGSIPACAGEPRSRSSRVASCRVYPRVCGGAHGRRGQFSFSWGLSPRVRGSPWALSSRCRSSGSIPACAGEPISRSSTQKPPGVYPRVCGGALAPIRSDAGFRGLSPRVRGSPSRRNRGPGCDWSIPACAGEPQPPQSRPRLRLVYPRVCGGAGLRNKMASYVTGLSPRVRGSLARRSGLISTGGSIPACAGEPITPRRWRSVIRVYPRVCGGAPLGALISQVRTGLSPRVRGSLPVPHVSLLPVGSIPACAGEPSTSSTSVSARRVYPRVCGGADAIR